MLPPRCSVIVYRRRQNMITLVFFLFLPEFDVIWDLLRSRLTAAWNIFVQYNYIYIYTTACILFLVFKRPGERKLELRQISKHNSRFHLVENVLK